MGPSREESPSLRLPYAAVDSRTGPRDWRPRTDRSLGFSEMEKLVNEWPNR